MAAEQAAMQAAGQIPWAKLMGLGGAGLGLGAAGSFMGSGSEGLFGHQGKTREFGRLTKPQQGLQNQAISQAQQLLSGGMGPSYQGFEPIAQQATSAFNQQIIPSLAERFTSMGGHGTAALSSPAFASQLGQAGSGLAENLAAMKSQYGMQQQGLNQNLLNQLLGYGLQPSMEKAYTPSQPGFLETSGQAILQALPYLMMLI